MIEVQKEDGLEDVRGMAQMKKEEKNELLS